MNNLKIATVSDSWIFIFLYRAILIFYNKVVFLHQYYVAMYLSRVNQKKKKVKIVFNIVKIHALFRIKNIFHCPDL